MKPDEFIDTCDRRTLSLRRSITIAGLEAEAMKLMEKMVEIGREKLESYRAVELEVLGFVDNAHPPAAEVLKDFIVGNCLADHGKLTRPCIIPPARGINLTSVTYGRGEEESNSCAK